MENGENAKNALYLGQIILGAAFALWALRLFFKSSAQSQFRDNPAKPSKSPTPLSKSKTEAPLQGKAKTPDFLAESRLESASVPKLAGISLQAPSHELLNVSLQASAEEINRAYKELMKRYHPDKVGPQGSREWQDAQAIAHALGRAREDLLKRLERRSGSAQKKP